MSNGHAPVTRSEMPAEVFTALLERLHTIQPTLTEQAPANEALGYLTDSAFDALKGTGVLTIETPTVLNGLEGSPRQILEALRVISYGDPSTGWVAMATLLATGVTASQIDDEGAAELFGNGKTPLIAGQGARMGQAVPVEGGYRLSGNWSFASGVANATHLHSGGEVVGTGERIILVFPKDQATLEGNWDVMGLKATGSFDYSTSDLFVPAHMTFPLRGGAPKRGGSLYRLTLENASSIGHAGWALGVGRRLLDEMRAMASAMGRTGKFGSAHFFADFGRAEALVRSSRALLFETWARVEDYLVEHEKLDTELASEIRLALYNITWSTHEASQLLYRWAGTAGLRDGVFQRLFRDVHGGTQHITSGQAVIEGVGEWYSGVSPEGSWVFSAFASNGE
jgi:alkylation response protein AidB-like acyl-CoA dehydrogenase